MIADSDKVEAIADIARRYLLDPPGDDDSVVDHLDPAELSARFDEVIPIELGADVPARSAAELEAAAALVVQHSVRTSHPRFFNQNFAGPDAVAVAGDWLGAALNTTNATYEAAPVFTLMEAALLRKLAGLAGFAPTELPPGLFAPGGSTATLYALQLARFRRFPDVVTTGVGIERLVLFVSASGHYSAKKSAALLGLGTDAVVEVATDRNGAMRTDALIERIESVRRHGRTPFAVIATSGTTVTSAFDPLGEIADVCSEADLWLHVDGCYGGSALFSKQHRHRLAGVEKADSFVWNLHKMMGMTQQCTALLVADPDLLGPCFATGADYLFQPDKLNAEYDSGDRHFQCARRVDALKLWLSWQAHGDQGFSDRVDRAVELADHARRRLADDDRFETVVGGDFTNVVFVWLPPEARSTGLADLEGDQRRRLHDLAPRIKSLMQRDGSAMVGYQPVDGVNTFRLLFMNPTVTEAAIDRTLELIDQYGSQAASSTSP